MSLCSFCKKGQREHFVALSNGREYVICTNCSCGYFCSVKDFPTYEKAVQLDVSTTFTGKDSPLCQHKKPSTLRVSHSEKNPGRPYFGCKEHWPCLFFCWANLELNLCCAPQPSADEWKKTFEHSLSVVYHFCCIGAMKNLMFWLPVK